MVELLTGLLPTGVVIALLVALLVNGLVVAPPNRRPSSAMAWILLMVSLPGLGLLLFALIGSPKLPPSRRDKQRTINDRIETSAASLGHLAATQDIPGWVPAVARLNRRMGALPMVDGNTARLLKNFSGQLDALIGIIDVAERYIHLECYIVSHDQSTAPLFDALAAARQRGVQVRVLLDHLGSRGYPGYQAATAALDAMGAEWQLMLPVQPLRGRYQRPDLRNHRKLVVVDGQVAHVGSLNVIEPGYQRARNARRGLQWKDLVVEVRGPVVHEVEALFVTDWYSETGNMPPASEPLGALVDDQDPQTLLAQVCPSGPAFEAENNLALFNSLIYAAQRRVSITSPYFVPEESLLAALVTAVRRGVDVELFVSEVGDQFFVAHAQHSYYRELLAAGVRIHLYPAPSVLHAKHVSVDDSVALVGSSNMDIRSMQLNFELMLLIVGRSFCDELRAVEDSYRRVSRELPLHDWDRRGRVHTIIDGVARLTSAVQ